MLLLIAVDQLLEDDITRIVLAGRERRGGLAGDGDFALQFGARYRDRGCRLPPTARSPPQSSVRPPPQQTRLVPCRRYSALPLPLRVSVS